MLRILIMCYVNCETMNGDSIRLEELVRCLSKQCVVSIIAVNARCLRLRGVARSYSVPKIWRFMPISWNVFSVLYGLWVVLTDRPDVVHADMAPGSIGPAVLSFLTRLPLSIELHGPVGAQDVALYRRTSPIKVALARMMERIMARRARLVIGAE